MEHSKINAKVGVYATVSPFSGDLLGDSLMSNVLDKSFIHRSYPKLANLIKPINLASLTYFLN